MNTIRETMPSRCGAVYTFAVPALAAALLTGCGRRDADTASTTRASGGPGPGYLRFINSPDGLTGTLATHYVDFWFDYPAGCEVVRQGLENPDNFVCVNRRSNNGEIVEQLNVGNFWIKRTDLEMQAAIDQLVESMKQSLTANRQNISVVNGGRSKVGGYEAYRYEFSQRIRHGGREGVESWIVGAHGERLPPPPELDAMVTGATYETVRMGFALIPQPGTRHGVVILTAARGEPGPLAASANSFRFGRP